MKAWGIIVIVLGAACWLLLGRNFGVCQDSIVRAANILTCKDASTFHYAGILSMLIGGLVLGLGFVRTD